MPGENARVHCEGHLLIFEPVHVIRPTRPPYIVAFHDRHVDDFRLDDPSVVVLYFVAAILMKSEPVIRPHQHYGEEFCDAYARTRRPSSDHTKRRQQTLERRLRNLESIVTSKESDWEQRLRT